MSRERDMALLMGFRLFPQILGIGNKMGKNWRCCIFVETTWEVSVSVETSGEAGVIYLTRK